MSGYCGSLYASYCETLKAFLIMNANTKVYYKKLYTKSKNECTDEKDKGSKNNYKDHLILGS